MLLSSKRREGFVRVRERRDERTACVGSSTKCLATKSFGGQRMGTREILFRDVPDIFTVIGCKYGMYFKGFYGR